MFPDDLRKPRFRHVADDYRLEIRDCGDWKSLPGPQIPRRDEVLDLVAILQQDFVFLL